MVKMQGQALVYVRVTVLQIQTVLGTLCAMKEAKDITRYHLVV